MLAGKVYVDLTRKLIEARARAVILTDEYNRSLGQSHEVHEAILRGRSL
ncbi:maltose acetyltransferase domain-containing protein [Microvirga massiliensis]